METVTYDDWTAEVDLEANGAAYAQITQSGSNECGCQDCRNFAAVRDAGLLYPQRILELLRSIGVDPALEAESWSVGPVIDGHPGLHAYGWWFNVIGNLCTGGLARSRELGTTLQLYPVSGGALAAPSFGDSPLFRIEFMGALPWMLNEASWQTEWESQHGSCGDQK